jgi:PAS domain S-box-containing protein
MPDGRTKYIEERCENFFAADGTPLRSVGLVQDITERKQTESQKEIALAALRENELQLRVLFETISEGIALNEMICNENGEMVDYRVLNVNPAFYSTADYRGKEVVGSLATELYGMSPEFIREFWRQHKEKNTNSYTEMYSPLGNRCFFVATSPFVNGRFVTSFFDITERKQTEEALQEKEELFRTMAQNSSDLITLTDENNLLLYASPQCENILGYSGDEFIGKRMPYNIHPEDTVKALEVWSQAKAGREVRDFEYRIVDAQGKVRWLSHTAKQVSVNSRILGIQSTIKDITERKQSEESLRTSEELFRSLAQASPNAIYILDIPTSKTIYFNHDAFLGYSYSELLAKNSLLNALHPEDAPAVIGYWKQVMNGEMLAPIEYRLRHKNGDWEWVDCRGVVLSRSTEGTPAQMMIILDVITERKQAEEALRESEAKWKGLFSILPVGVSILNEHGALTDMNPALERILDITKDDLMNGTHRQRVYLHPNNREMRPEEFPSTRAMKEQRDIHDIEIGIIKKMEDKSIIWTNVSAAPLPGGSCVIVTTDITERKRTEDELRRWAKIFEHAEWGIVVGSADGTMIELTNPAFARMHGYSIDELKGQSPLSLFAPEVRAELPVNIKLAHDKGHHVWESIHLRKDGSRFPVLIDVTAVRDEYGDVLYRVINVQDITERKQAEEARRASEEQYRTIIQTAMDGYWLTDAQGHLLDVNEGYCQMSGYDKQELLGMSIPDLEASETSSDTAAHIHKIVLSGEDRFESMHRRKDGSIFNVEISVQYKSMDGGRFVVFLRDITERKQAEEELLISEERFKMIFNESPIGIALVNSQTGKIENANPMYAKITGRSVEELMNLDWTQYTHPDDIPVNLDNVARMHSGQSNGFQMEKRYLHPDGSIVWVNLKDVPLHIRGAAYPIHLAMTEDITERKRAEEALRISEEKYRTVADFTYDWEAWRGPDGKYVYVSPSCKRITGYAAEEFQSDADLVLKITHPHDISKMHEHRDEVAHQTERMALEFEFRIITANGETRWINHTCVPVYGKNGDFLGRRENNRDVTERKRAELALRDSEHRLREIVDAAPFGAHVYQVDENGQLIFMDANESASEILGVDNNAFVGKTFEEAFPYLVRSELPQMYRRVANQGIRYNAPRFNYKDGRLSATFEIHAIQIAPGRVAAFFRNISELEAAYDETIVGWSRAMDLRDKETEEHTERVTNMSVEVARIMGFSEIELLNVRWGALLHDIGKIGIPDSILLKPGNLTEEEQALMRKHPVFAYEMLVPIRFLRPALDVPYCHHEKWDGTGYPRGLKGAEIPVSARIFALVDVWDALRSDRPYRKKWPKQKTIEHIRSLAGTHFDPALVDVFLEFVSRKKS